MKYCVACGDEYVDTAKQCSDCGGTELVSAEEMHARGLLLPSERDTSRFLQAGTAEDPLSAEQFVGLLQAQRIPVFARPRRGGSVDTITSSTGNWWEILVPEGQVERASALISEEKARITAGADEASRAAEEEEAAGEAAAKPA